MGPERPEKLLGFLLRMFPAGFRDDHGHDMHAMLRAELRETREERARLGTLHYWWRLLCFWWRTVTELIAQHAKR